MSIRVIRRGIDYRKYYEHECIKCKALLEVSDDLDPLECPECKTVQSLKKSKETRKELKLGQIVAFHT